MSIKPYEFGDIVHMWLARAKKAKYFMYAGRDVETDEARLVVISTHYREKTKHQKHFHVIKSNLILDLPRSNTGESRFDLDELFKMKPEEMDQVGARRCGKVSYDVRSALVQPWINSQRCHAPVDFQEVLQAFLHTPTAIAAE